MKRVRHTFTNVRGAGLPVQVLNVNATRADDETRAEVKVLKTAYGYEKGEVVLMNRLHLTLDGCAAHSHGINCGVCFPGVR